MRPNMRREHQYKPLLSAVPEDDLEKDLDSDSPGGFVPSSLKSSSRRYSHSDFVWRVVTVVVVVQSLAIVVLIWTLLARNPTQYCSPVHPQVLYSPAQDVLEYQPKTFTPGLGHGTTIYQGEPSEELDKAWTDLFADIGVSKIPKSEARLLPNKTLPIPGDEENYAVALAVFHQLHCLNIVRKGLWREHYTDLEAGNIAGIPEKDWPDHLSHCLDDLRQSLMCSADISLVVWQWVESANRATPRMDVVHSCRNFDTIVDWAKAHPWDRDFDLTVHVEDDIEIPVF